MLHAAITLFFAVAGWLAYSGAGLAVRRVLYRARTCAGEYRWIDAYGNGHRDNMPWWGGFDPRVWNRKSLLDWLLPVCVALLAEAGMSTGGLYNADGTLCAVQRG